MKIENWKIDRVIPYENNPRIHTEKAITKVAESIKQFGWRQPIVVDGDGIVLAGHTRLLAAKRLNLATVPVHLAKDITPELARRYRIADNRVAEESEWDADKLMAELGDMSLDGIGLDGLGFDDKELVSLLNAKAPSLDELEAANPEDEAGGEQAFWATLKIKVSPETLRAYKGLLALASGDSEDEQFASIINAAVAGYSAPASDIGVLPLHAEGVNFLADHKPVSALPS